MRFAEQQLQEIVISLIRGNVLTAQQDWLGSIAGATVKDNYCLLYTSPSPRDRG